MYLIVINVIAYSMMWLDKTKAIRKQNRISERSLFLMAVLLAAPGIYLGMKRPLHHKASKAVFKFGIPMILVFNFFVIYYIYHSYLYLGN